MCLKSWPRKKKYLKLAFHSEQETGSVPHQASNERVHALEHTSKSNACKPEVPSQMELPLVEFLPHMEESIDIANYLGQEQAFSNCNDLPSSMLPEDAELLFNSSCHILTDLTNANNKMTLTPSIFELQTYSSRIYTALI